MPHYRVPSLSGVFAEAVDQGHLDPSIKGLDALVERLRGGPEGFVTIGERIEEARWPLRNDVALARFAARAYPKLPGRLEVSLNLVERWLEGEVISVDLLKINWQVAHAIHWGSSWADQERTESEEIFRRIHTDIAPVVLVELDRAYRDPVADVLATEMVTMVASAAHGASEGWLAYYAHRRLSSPVAASAARAISIAAGAMGNEIWELVIGEALRLPIDAANPGR